MGLKALGESYNFLLGLGMMMDVDCYSTRVRTDFRVRVSGQE